MTSGRRTKRADDIRAKPFLAWRYRTMQTLRLLAATVLVETMAFGCGEFIIDPAPSGPVDASSDADAGVDAPEEVDLEASISPVFEGGPGSDFTGRSEDGGPCRPHFASGVNVAWVRYADDVPNPSLATFRALFGNVYAAGGRVARWWFHTNGTHTPGYDDGGMTLPISPSNIADVKSILDTARESGMMITISLWSFDMLKGNIPPATLANNIALLTVDNNRQAYIDNVLTPLVTALAGYPGLYSWETFNEPEGMASGGQGWRPFTYGAGADGGTTGAAVDISFIQKSVNWFAAAIHAADPQALVTNGTWEFQAVSNVTGMSNYYSDAELLAAGGMPGGTLDYYEVHYYSADGVKYSPFVNPVSHWGLDKPVVLGEFYALSQDGVDVDSTYTTLHDAGYAGAWAWQYLNSDGANASNGGQVTDWPSMQVPIQNLYAEAPEDLACF
jgi:hypothetical protein